MILLSVILNIIVSIFFPLTKILNYNETFFILVFDLLQLVGLLFLTGGLTNPFCVLILAPLVISATYLDLKRIIIITAVPSFQTSNVGGMEINTPHNPPIAAKPITPKLTIPLFPH